ncbi:MAG: hypothetical protein HY824_13705 [Acidobacteria bacterium]|nr:hypothetical protein [Acidobacteriota bacterium]
MNLRRFAACLVILITIVCASPVAAADWSVPHDFPTIQEAIDSPEVADGDRIVVGPGSFAGARVTKSVQIQGVGRTVISSGPVHPSGLVQGFRLFDGSDGTTIGHLRFEVDLPIINATFNHVDNVTVTQNTLVNPVQGISDWLGSGWTITHNDIVGLRTRCGGGIAILIGDYSGGAVTGNVVAHNRISGTVHVSPTDCGGYGATGVVLYADFRWGAAGGQDLAFNRVIENAISLTSDTPAVVDVVAIELTEAEDPDPSIDVIHDNAIGFNDLRGTEGQLALTPSALGDSNDISRNLGENRGHGLRPAAFGLGGYVY